MSNGQDAFRLAAGLDPARLRPVFTRARRIHIPGILEADGARELYEFLARHVPWSLVLNSGDKVYDLDAAARAALGPEKERELVSHVYQQARRSFQYLYESCRVADDAAERARAATPLTRFMDFMNSPTCISFLRELTGQAAIDFADAQATCYRAGHFLGVHDDEVPGKSRIAAYVFNLTPRWEADWGGQLQFVAADGHVSEAYVPRFNALNVFLVRQPHLVSYVAPFAAGARYSVTGWLRTRGPAAP